MYRNDRGSSIINIKFKDTGQINVAVAEFLFYLDAV